MKWLIERRLKWRKNSLSAAIVEEYTLKGQLNYVIQKRKRLEEKVANLEKKIERLNKWR